MESGSDVDVIYLDFSKTFDKVDQGLLLYKLRSMVVRGSLLKWITSILLDRQQAVAIDGNMSRWSPVISGVPQGTVLGPILFLAHIIDIDVCTNSSVSCFADDTRVMRAITNAEDVEELQRNLERIYSWADKKCV